MRSARSITPHKVDSLIAEGIYDSYWGMVTEYPDPAYPDSSIQVQYQKINFAWATPPPFPYTATFDDWHLVKKESGELHMRDAAKVNFYPVP